jgi:hypothetical protein
MNLMLLCYSRLVYDAKTRNPISITGYPHAAVITTCNYPHINSNSETVVGLVFTAAYNKSVPPIRPEFSLASTYLTQDTQP